MSDFYKYKSGSQKRKEKEKRDEDAQKGQKNIDTLFKRTRTESPGPDISRTTSTCDEIGEQGPSTSLNAVLSQEQEIDVTPSSPSTELGASLSSEHALEITEIEHQSQLLADNYSDIGTFQSRLLSDNQIEQLVRAGPGTLPRQGQIGRDETGKEFPTYIFLKKLENGEEYRRDYLSYSTSKNSLYCFPCRLFLPKQSDVKSMPALATPEGSGKSLGYQRLYKAIPAHENSQLHRRCHLIWREMELRLKSDLTIEDQLLHDVKSEKKKWREILQCILDVILFLGERSLSFRGHSEKIGDPHNGNFLGILELLSHYDPILKEHILKVKESQTQGGKKLQAHYLSKRTQNEFISLCGNKLRQTILSELSNSKYYAIMVDATPDVSCQEQSTFVFRYLIHDGSAYVIKERFFTFIDDNGKTGAEIASMILKLLYENGVPLSDCHGQGYDTAANMSGEYNGVQSHLKDKNSLIKYSPCACHSLNLCGNDAAECCKEAITFFGMVQWIYNFFHSSPKRCRQWWQNVLYEQFFQSKTFLLPLFKSCFCQSLFTTNKTYDTLTRINLAFANSYFTF